MLAKVELPPQVISFAAFKPSRERQPCEDKVVLRTASRDTCW